MQEIRFLFSMNNTASSGVRNFTYKNYQLIQELNPRLPFIIRTGESDTARIFARYDFGKETEVVVEGLSEEEVEEKVRELVMEGENMPRSQESRPKDRDVIMGSERFKRTLLDEVDFA
eukprot:TRINITY_DN11665_c0_g1_i1.p1 TRINITY_DN11665_c0_g1~~TRINITY_DN11665_c0_g1_i1.p1  ORF type:complete len:136 (+),score=21.76 TRINITY_DN11665_c0_g1_i1:55-408(+)